MNLWRAKNIPLNRQAAKQADRLADAFADSVDIEGIIVQWLSSYHEGDEMSPQQAREWAKNHLVLPTREIEDVLRDIYAIGAKLGRQVALAAIAQQTVRKAIPKEQINAALNVDWANWTPGNNPATALLRPRRGLSNILNRTAKTARLLQDTTLSRIGTRLADALQQGWTVRQTAQVLREVVKDSRRALVIAQTEMSRALMAEQADTYQEYGVEEVEWLALDPCEVCSENEAASPLPVGEEFPSGDLFPPAHPNCYCDLVPVIEGFEAVDGNEYA